jgi:superfamily II helicase
MTMYCALTVRKLKPGTYDEWRKAWMSDEDNIPEGGEAYIVRNLKDPDEIIAFGLIEGDIDAIKASFDEGEEQKRQEAMAPYIDSVGADGIYEVIERVGAKTTA